MNFITLRQRLRQAQDSLYCPQRCSHFPVRLALRRTNAILANFRSVTYSKQVTSNFYMHSSTFLKRSPTMQGKKNIPQSPSVLGFCHERKRVPTSRGSARTVRGRTEGSCPQQPQHSYRRRSTDRNRR